MLLSPPLEMQPFESFPISVDFSVEFNLLSDTVNTFTVTAKNRKTGVDASADVLQGSPSRSGNRITQTVKGGTSGLNYRIEFRVTGVVSTNKFEAEVDILVKEV